MRERAWIVAEVVAWAALAGWLYHLLMGGM